MDRYRKEEKDSEEDISDSRERSPGRKKGGRREHRNRNYKKITSPIQENVGRDDSPSEVSVRNRDNSKTLPPKKRIRSDEETPIDGSGGDGTNLEHQKTNDAATTGNQDEDLRLLLLQQQSPSRDRKMQNRTAVKGRDRSHRPIPNFDHVVPPPTNLPGSHAFVAGAPPPGLLPPPPMGPPPQQIPFPHVSAIEEPDVKAPDPIPANNRIFVDGKAYEVKYVEDIPVIERNGQPHKIYFTGPPRDVVIDGVAYSLAFGDKKTVRIDGQPHHIRSENRFTAG